MMPFIKTIPSYYELQQQDPTASLAATLIDGDVVRGVIPIREALLDESEVLNHLANVAGLPAHDNCQRQADAQENDESDQEHEV